MCKRALAFALVLLLLLLTACSTAPAADAPANNDTPANAPANNDTPADSDTPADTETPAGSDTPATGNAPAEDDPYGGLVLPLSDGSTTFRVYRATSDSITRFEWNDFSQVPGFARAEELTGVKIQWEVASDFITQFPLMIASGDWPDAGFYWMNGNFMTGLDKYVDDEIMLDLTDLIHDYCPNYAKIRTGDEVTARDTMEDDGRLVAFYNIMKSEQGAFMANVANGKWIREWGGDPTLTTYDDYHDFLAFAVDKYHPEAPYTFNAKGLDPILMAGFELSPDWVVIEGDVQYSPAEERCKEYVELMRQWWSEGLLWKDVFSGERYSFQDAAAGGAAINMCSMAWIDWQGSFSEDPEYYAQPVHYPAKKAGDIRHIAHSFSIPRKNEGCCGYLFSTCQDPVVMAQWFDFWYTEPGALLANYGIEGVSYEFDENGKPYFIGYVVDNEEGYAASTAWLRYIADNVPHHYDWEREINDTMSENALSSQSIWDGNYEEKYTYPKFVTRPLEESEEFGRIMADVQTYVQENIPRFINGEKSMDEWDDYAAHLKAIGIDKAIRIQQDAYDRYIARGTK